MDKTIKKYWEVQPPFKGEGRPGSLEWSRSISAHRLRVSPHWARFLNASASKGQTVLEIGVGAGSDSLEFAKSGATVYGVDITRRAISVAKQRFGVEQIPSCGFHTYDGRQLFLGDHTCDLVFSGGVLHHTPRMDDLLAETHRVLKPGGELRFMVYHRHSLLYYYLMHYWQEVMGDRRSRDDLISAYSEFRPGCPYTRCFTKNEIKDRLWYFSKVQVNVAYFVYDDPASGDRKVRGEWFMRNGLLPDSDVPDIQQFFASLRRDYQSGGINLDRKYGWHLLVSAWK